MSPDQLNDLTFSAQVNHRLGLLAEALRAGAVVYRHRRRPAHGWLIAAVPRYPVIEAAFCKATANLVRLARGGDRSNPWILTGPGNLTCAVLDRLAGHERAGQH